MTFATQPKRELTTEEVRAFQDDGGTTLKQVLAPNWMTMMEASTEEVRFFCDQMLVKEPGTDAPTLRHQDLSSWPIRGEQICSFWIPCDPVNRDNSGLLYVRGSHRWSQRFNAISPDYIASIIDRNMDDIPNINASPNQYDLADGDMEPGDILAFHPLTLHGSYGNASCTHLCALALRGIDDNVVYASLSKRMSIHYKHDPAPGRPLRSAGKLLASGFYNVMAAARQTLRAKCTPTPKQTWTR